MYSSPLILFSLQACQTLSKVQEEQIKKKFEVAYMVAKKEMPFTAYEDFLSMEAHHGVDVGTAYTNRFQCAEFIDCHGEYLAENLKSDLMKAKFYSVLVDGSTDNTITEKEVVYVLYFDPDSDSEKVQVKLSFLYLKDVGVPDANGIRNAIERSFQNIGILPCQVYEKLVGLGADGASVNSGNKSGVKALLSEKAPWLIFQWCVAHRLELALKDALHNSYFKKVDNMLLRLFYLYHKSPKKLFELKSVYDEMKHTFEFDEGGLKPKRACGTRWISFKLAAMKLVFDKFGIYMAHLKKMAPKIQKVKAYLNKWNTPYMLQQVAFFIDVLTPVSHLSKVYQGEGTGIVEAGEALGKMRKRLGKLKSRDIEDFPVIKTCLRRVHEVNGKTVYQGVEFSTKEFKQGLETLKRKKNDVLDSVDSCISSRLDDSSDPLIEKAAVILNAECWLARSKVFNLHVGLDDDDDDVESFADEELMSIFEHFCPLLKNAGVDCTAVELLDEWHALLSYSVKFLKPERNHYLKTWKFLFKSSMVSRWRNVLTLVELLFSIPVSNAKLERLFSRLKRTKVDARGSLGEKRLTNLLRIGEEGPDVATFDVAPVVKFWCSKRNRRPNQGTKRKLCVVDDKENKRRRVQFSDSSDDETEVAHSDIEIISESDMSDSDISVDEGEFWNELFISDSDDDSEFDGFQ